MVFSYGLFVGFHYHGHTVFHFVNVGKPELLKAGVYFGGAYAARKLTDEYGRHQCNTVIVFENLTEIILLDKYGVRRAYPVAFTTIDAFVVVEQCLALTYSDGFGRARFHAVGATRTLIPVDGKGVVERTMRSFLFHGSLSDW